MIWPFHRHRFDLRDTERVIVDGQPYDAKVFRCRCGAFVYQMHRPGLKPIVVIHRPAHETLRAKKVSPPVTSLRGRWAK